MTELEPSPLVASRPQKIRNIAMRRTQVSLRADVVKAVDSDRIVAASRTSVQQGGVCTNNIIDSPMLFP